jgi:hypothetical protein
MANPKAQPKHVSWADTNPNPITVAEEAASGTDKSRVGAAFDRAAQDYDGIARFQRTVCDSSWS